MGSGVSEASSIGISSELFNSLKASTKVIERLKKENARLKAEKASYQAQARQSDTMLEEVRQGLTEAGSSNGWAQEKKAMTEQLEQVRIESVEAQEEAKKCDRLLKIAYEGLRVANPKAVENIKLTRERDQVMKEKAAADAKIKKCEALLKEAYKQLEGKTKKGYDFDKVQAQLEATEEIAKLKREKEAALEQVEDIKMKEEIGGNLSELVRKFQREKAAAEEKVKNCEVAYEQLEAKAKADKKKLLKAHGKLMAEKEQVDAKVEECEELLKEAYGGLKKAKLSSKQKGMLREQRNRLHEELQEAEAKAEKYEILLNQVFGEMQEKKMKLRIPPNEKKKRLITTQVPKMRPITNFRPVDDLIFQMLPQEKPFYFF